MEKFEANMILDSKRTNSTTSEEVIIIEEDEEEEDTPRESDHKIEDQSLGNVEVFDPEEFKL